jgi:hypothetical protein
MLHRSARLGCFLAFAPVVVLGALSLSCSSETKRITSGGARFQLQAAAGGSCPNPGQVVQIYVIGEDGGAKLIVDGTDGASAQCNFNGEKFEVAVSNEHGALVASGNFSGDKATNVEMTLSTGPGVGYKSASPHCTVDFTQKADGNLTGRFICPELFNPALGADKKCAVSAVESSGTGTRPAAFFQFADCGSF